MKLVELFVTRLDWALMDCRRGFKCGVGRETEIVAGRRGKGESNGMKLWYTTATDLKIYLLRGYFCSG